MNESVLNVLVVEDHEDTRFLIRATLERLNGYRVVEASDGARALEVAEERVPHCILMDLNLPVLDGFMATLRLLSNPLTAHIPVIAVSGHCWDYDWEPRALSVGCVECVRKPIDFDALDKVIKKHVRPGSGRPDPEVYVKKL